MNDIERYLDKACRSVSGPASLRRHLRDELKEHMEEAINEFVATGMPEEEATRKVIDEFGEPEMVREGLESVYGRSITALLIEKSMDWKEITMKTEWKWNFTAQFGLALIIALTAFFIGSAYVFITPMVVQMHADVGINVPTYLGSMIDVARLIDHTMWIWVIALAGGVWLFEWKCKSENKSLIRTTIGVGTSLALIVIAFWVAVAIVIPLTHLQREAVEQKSESVALPGNIDTSDSNKQLVLVTEGKK